MADIIPRVRDIHTEGVCQVQGDAATLSPGQSRPPPVFYHPPPVCVDPSPHAKIPQGAPITAVPMGAQHVGPLPPVGCMPGGFWSTTGFFPVSPDAQPIGDRQPQFVVQPLHTGPFIPSGFAKPPCVFHPREPMPGSFPDPNPRPYDQGGRRSFSNPAGGNISIQIQTSSCSVCGISISYSEDEDRMECCDRCSLCQRDRRREELLAQEIEAWKEKAKREAAERAERARLQEEAEAKQKADLAAELQKAKQDADEATVTLKYKLEEEAKLLKKLEESEAAAAEASRVYQQELAKAEASAKQDFSNHLATELAKIEAAAKADTAKFIADELNKAAARSKADTAKIFATEAEKHKKALEEAITRLTAAHKEATDSAVYHNQNVAAQQAEVERRWAEAAKEQKAEMERRRAEAAKEQQAEMERRWAVEVAKEQQAEIERRWAEAAKEQQAEEAAKQAALKKAADDEAAQRAIQAQAQAEEEQRVITEIQKQLHFAQTQYDEFIRMEDEQNSKEEAARKAIQDAEEERERAAIREMLSKEFGSADSNEDLTKRLNALKVTDATQQPPRNRSKSRGRKVHFNLENF
ncbi:hypothetical protein BZA05DRAFT_470597 [Tricharina praecox]|uniref:uncharacterized protein n=1 Tax=Tricharina praecox TaxID=43433 RepID=UPI0022208751|nr:uncharacterized protein BZA05DRAFT_470597 [Tricharina praecox]KAI5857728.1 hypothetical protein BZA05DRAFT_470597 [Tricharina praecox]